VKRFVCSVVLVAAVGCALAPAQAKTLTLIAPGGIRAAVEQLIPGFERKTGYKVKATFGSGLGTKLQVARGESFDVPIVQPPYPDVLESGNVVPGSAKTLASVSVGIAVKMGATRPDISTAEALKRTLLGAKSVAYPDSRGGAAAGVSFEDALRKLGIASQMEPKLKRAQGGAAAMAMTAKGEAEIGVTFLSEMSEPGLDIVGALPKDLVAPTTLVAFVGSHAKDPAGARALVEWLASPDAAVVYKAQGMQPGR
jgi:molybdate transport system substrate-binding protein